MVHRTRYIIAVAALWLALFCLISAMPVLSGVMTWQRSLGDTLVQWLPWILFSPIIFWIVLRFPIGRPGIGWRVLLHLVSGGVFVVLAAWLSTFCLASQFLGEPPNGPEGGDHGPAFAGQNQNGPGQSGSSPNGPNWPGHPSFHDHHTPGPPFSARISFNVPIYLTLLSLSHTFVYLRRAQQRERRAIELESQLNGARLQALRMQLQPHFLFNTLNAISTLVQTDAHAAQEMIGSLGQMLRLSLDSGSEVEVPLEQELKFLNSYLEIAEIRFGDRLQLKRQIPPVEVLQAYVPTFILQPLVENALKHGIEPGVAAGTIEIRTERAGDRLLLSVSDSGVGLAGAGDVMASNGIGLSNTRARLQNLYPGQYRFSVRNRAEGGCVAELEIPFHTEPLVTQIQSKTV